MKSRGEARKITGVFGGSFNPVHLGHTALADELVKAGIVDEVWLTLSPLNPLKAKPEELMPDAQRLAMLNLAVEGHKGLRTCDIELFLPRPSYTIVTLRKLQELYPGYDFRLVIGADNFAIFDRWKNAGEIARDFSPIVYPRPGVACAAALDLPVNDFSSTEVRTRIKNGLPVNTMVDSRVLQYITDNKLYR